LELGNYPLPTFPHHLSPKAEQKLQICHSAIGSAVIFSCFNKFIDVYISQLFRALLQSDAEVGYSASLVEYLDQSGRTQLP
jgi:hypothetical protein